MMLTHCGNNVRNRYSGCVFSVKDIVPVPLKTSRNRNTIYKFLRAGELPGLQLGRKWLVSESALASFLHKKLLEQTDSRKTATVAWLDKIVKIGASFTPRASRTLSFTHDEAVNCGHDYIGTEHLLLAINDVPQSVASKALAGMSVDAQALRKKILARVGTGNADGSETLQPTPRLLKVIKSSLKSSVRKKAHYVGAEDLLLALVEQKKVRPLKS